MPGGPGHSLRAGDRVSGLGFQAQARSARLQVARVAEGGIGAGLAGAEAERLLESGHRVRPAPLLAEHVAQVDQRRLPRCAAVVSGKTRYKAGQPASRQATQESRRWGYISDSGIRRTLASIYVPMFAG